LPHTDPVALPPVSDPAAELHARRSLRRSLRRRASVLRTATRRRRTRTGAVVLVGAMTLAGGAAFAHKTGGAAAGTGAGKDAKRSSKTTGAGPIAAVQAKLGVAADGVWGPQSRRALKRWQRAQGLPADGVIGAATLTAMGITATAPQASGTIKESGAGGVSTALSRIAQCESGGNPAAISRSGRYRGKYQFSRATWRAMGGTGDPAKAPEAEQDRIAAELYAARGTAPWPSCARR